MTETPNGKKNIHADHRQRIKKQVLDEGMWNMPEHLILEFLLYYSIPYRDTNPLAHRLIERYGSLAGVLEAEYHDLLQVEGVGEHTAMLLSSLPQVFRRYALNKSQKPPFFADREVYSKYAMDLSIGLTREEFYMICLNRDNRLLQTERLAVGSVSEVVLHTREAVRVALRHNASAVILVHNHPSANLKPSAFDFAVTDSLGKALAEISVRLIDHLIVGGGKYLSFVEQGYPLIRSASYK